MQAHPFFGGLVLAPPEPAPLAVLNAAAGRAWRSGEAVNGLAPILRPSPRRAAKSVAAPAHVAGLRRTYALCGRPIAVDFAPPALEAYVDQRFGHARDDAAAPIACIGLSRLRRGYALSAPGVSLRFGSETGLIGAFVRRYVELSYPECAWRAVVHAAAVSMHDRAVIMPGPNGSGKSTLVAALLAAGCGYLSDDCAPISREGLVIPVPFGLCLKAGSWEAAAPYLPNLAETPVVRGPGGASCRFVPPPSAVQKGKPPGLFVFPTYRSGTSVATRQLDPIETLTRLVEGRVWLSREPEDLSATLAMLERLPAFALEYGDLANAAAAVLQLADGPASPVIEAAPDAGRVG